eukprot:Rmarinus@m.26839
MGQIHTTQSKEEIQTLALQTDFTQTELKALHSHFKSLLRERPHEGFMGYREFCRAVGLRESLLTKRMFQFLDTDKDGYLDFGEFANGLSTFKSDGLEDDKLRFIFKLYDLDGDGFVSVTDFHEMLLDTIRNAPRNIPDTRVNDLVSKFFQETDLNQNGKLEFDEFKELLLRCPSSCYLENM